MERHDVPDEVPVPDAVEQRQDPTVPALDEEAAASSDDNPPLEAADPDWQEQREVVDSPEPDEYDRASDEYDREG
ncbi:hypothetical protein [Mycolicibacterium sp. XJ870]